MAAEDRPLSATHHRLKRGQGLKFLGMQLWIQSVRDGVVKVRVEPIPIELEILTRPQVLEGGVDPLSERA